MSQEKKNDALERRNFPNTIEIREGSADNNESRKIGGYALKYNAPTLIRDRWGDEWLEEFAVGAFDESIANCKSAGSEIKCLWNHDMAKPLGSTKNDSLRFNSNNTEGLEYEDDLPNNTWGTDAYESVSRGDVDGSSFGFRAKEDKWSKVEYEGKSIYKRSIIKADLYEVSPCTFPAYGSSDISCRSYKDYIESTKDELRIQKIKEESRLIDIQLENRSA